MGLRGCALDLELSDSRHHLRGKHGLAEVGSSEGVLAKLLGQVRPEHASAYAERLLRRFGTLGRVFGANAEALLATVGDQAAVSQLVATNAAINSVFAPMQDANEIALTGADIIRRFWLRLAFRDVECVAIAFLDGTGRLLSEEELARGSFRRADLEPRGIIRRALELNASKLVLAHNHPSGDPTPSHADRAATETIVAAARMFGVEIKDHVIVAHSGWSSMRALGWI